MDPRKSRPLTEEESIALEQDMIAVLEKHGAEMGVLARIEIVKLIPEQPPTDNEHVAEGAEIGTTHTGTPSPYVQPIDNGTDSPKTKEKEG